MNAFLENYVDSYELMSSNTNYVGLLIFAAVIFLLSRKLGIVQDAKVEFTYDWLLVVSMLASIGVFLCNFLIHGTVASFFSNMYQKEISNMTDEISWICPTSKDKHYLVYFQCVREIRLIPLTVASVVCLAVSVSCLVGWLTLNMLRRKENVRGKKR